MTNRPAQRPCLVRWPAYIAQSLERRVLLASGPDLVINATEGPDLISVAINAGANPGHDVVASIYIVVNQTTQYSVPSQDYGRIVVNGLGGNDQMLVHGLRDHPLLADLGAGDDSFTVTYNPPSIRFGLDPESSTGIWTNTLITVLGDVGNDTFTFEDLDDERVGNPNIVTTNYVIDSNTYTIAGTRVVTGYQFSGESFFATGAQTEMNGIEQINLLAANLTNRPNIISVDSLVASAATIHTANIATTVNVASFVGGGDVSVIGGAGDDVFNLGKMTNGKVERVDGGGGTNTLNLIGTDFAEAFGVSPAGAITGHTIASALNIQALTLDGAGGADTFNLDGTVGLPFTVKGGAGDDAFTLTGNVTTLPSIDVGPGSNTFVFNQQSYGAAVSYTFRTDGLQLAGPLNGLFGATNVLSFTVNAGIGDDQFLFATSFPYTANVHGGGGDDEVTIGGGNLAATSRSFTVAGDAGEDSIQYDDRFSITNLGWTITAVSIALGANIFGYSDFEEVNLFGNSTGSVFNLSGAIAVTLRIDTGGGADAVTLTNVYNTTGGVFYHSLYLTGGTGPTSDTLFVDDRTGLRTQYQIAENELYSAEIPLGARGLFLQYFFFASVTIRANDDATPVDVYGVGTDITQQMTLRLGGGDDTVTIHPRGTTGSHFSAALGIFGEAGTDRVTIDDTTNLNDTVYMLGNLSGSGTTNLQGLGVGVLGVFADVEAISLAGGAGNDTLKLDSYQTAGVPFTFAGGGGADNVEVAPTGLDVAAALTVSAPFTFDGGPGADTFKLFNQNNASAWTYTVTAAALVATRSGTPAFTRTFTLTNNEETDVNAGNAADTFTVPSAAVGSSSFLSGNGGADTYTVGPLDNISGLVALLGDAADSAVLDDTADITGDIAHIGGNFVGNAAGDTLFGAGGRVYSGGVGTLTLNLGSGADTIFAQPSAVTTLRINAGAPSGATGDALDLATSGVLGYALNFTGVGTGNISSSNRKALFFTGIDRPILADAIAPTVTSGAFLFNAPKPTVDVAFSEDVSSQLNTSVFELENLSVGALQTIDSSVMLLAYNPATNHATLTFPGLPGGILPDGPYRLTLTSQTFSDTFGNASTADFTLDFFVLAGDGNHDRVVNFDDLVILAQNYGQGGRSFSQGNFNYSTDGKVDFDDLVILAQRYGKSVPIPAPVVAPTAADAMVPTKRRRAEAEIF